MNGESEDRRFRKTRSKLRSVLEEMLGAAPLASISVSALCEKADINRATFYLHYRNTGHLLTETAVAYLTELTAGFEPVAPDNLDLDRPPEHLVKIFHHVSEHAALYHTFLCGENASPFHPSLMSLLEKIGLVRIDQLQKLKTSREPLAERGLIAYSGLGSLVGALVWWLQSGMKRSPEFMAERCAWILVAGTYSLLGMNPPAIDKK